MRGRGARIATLRIVESAQYRFIHSPLLYITPSTGNGTTGPDRFAHVSARHDARVAQKRFYPFTILSWAVAAPCPCGFAVPPARFVG